MTVQRINERADLIALMQELGIPGDWHEPDQADITAAVHGLTLDNAGIWPLDEGRLFTGGAIIEPMIGIPDIKPTPPHTELYVTLLHQGQPVAQLNLASLFAWATGMCGHVSPEFCKAEATERSAPR